MNLPTPPTDNLYKFAAVLGLSVALSGLGVYWYFSRELDRQRAAAAHAESVLDQRRNFLHREALNRKTELLADQRLYQSFMDKAELLDSDAFGIQEKRVQVALAESDAQRAMAMCIIAVVLGTGLMSAGFSLWYLRLQRHQDKLAQAKAHSGIVELPQ